MSVATTLPITAFAMSPWADRALSDEALVLRRLISDATEFSGSIAVGEPRRAVQEDLYVACMAAQVDDWDQAGSKGVEPSSVVYADQFLRLLPSIFVPPNVTVDTDGEVLFEWDRGPRHVFSVSVGKDGTLSFAGLFGHNKVH